MLFNGGAVETRSKKKKREKREIVWPNRDEYLLSDHRVNAIITGMLEGKTNKNKQFRKSNNTTLEIKGLIERYAAHIFALLHRYYKDNKTLTYRSVKLVMGILSEAATCGAGKLEGLGFDNINFNHDDEEEMEDEDEEDLISFRGEGDSDSSSEESSNSEFY